MTEGRLVWVISPYTPTGLTPEIQALFRQYDAELMTRAMADGLAPSSLNQWSRFSRSAWDTWSMARDWLMLADQVWVGCQYGVTEEMMGQLNDAESMALPIFQVLRDDHDHTLDPVPVEWTESSLKGLGQ